MSQRMLQDNAQKASAPTVSAPRQLPAHRHQHAGEVAPRGYPEGCVAHSSVPCQRNTRGAGQAQASSPDKNHVTSKSPVGDISVVTLIRTDTTLDHSQKAEKVCSRCPKAIFIELLLTNISVLAFADLSPGCAAAHHGYPCGRGNSAISDA